jgi:hypothetical protein
VGVPVNDPEGKIPDGVDGRKVGRIQFGRGGQKESKVSMTAMENPGGLHQQG